MKKALKVLLVLMIVVLLGGCDTNKNTNVKIDNVKYIDASDGVEVVSYNGYKVVQADKNIEDDESVTVIIRFDKVFK